MHRVALALISMLILLTFGSAAMASEDGFQEWLLGFKDRARAEGISNATLDAAFAGASENTTVIKLDRKQPDGRIGLARYLANTMPDSRVERARQLMREHRDDLERIGRKHGVQPKYIVALWAIESDFGRHMGGFSIAESLATLAYEGRRASFFEKELLAALKIMEKEGIAASDMTGSWAGAMGQCQFMPTTFLRYAADGDGDGKRDIWNTEADAFASIANYLSSLGWDDGQEWGHEVTVPEDFKRTEADIKQSRPSAYWRERGLMYDSEPVDNAQTPLYAVYPDATSPRVFLVTKNFQAILDWNRSRYFATAVGLLADKIGE